MTFDQRVAALGFLGLTPRQTRFVATVALHGGYCLRRQYAAFAGIAYGATVRDFLDMLVRRDVMTRVEYRRDRGFIYHLHAKAIYRAIDQDDNRNRRPASPALIARKLMLLDVALAHPTVTWLATEADKVELFTKRFGLSLADLPGRLYVMEDRPSSSAPRSATPSTTRYFVNKWPIFLTGPGDISRVYFVALILDSSGLTFSQFLTDHARLLWRLPAWTVIGVYPAGHSGVAASRAVFDRETSSAAPPRNLDGDADSELGRYFRTRRAVESGDLTSISVAEIDHYRDARTRFIGPAVERGYVRWRASGHIATVTDANSAARPRASGETSNARPQAAAEFQPYPLPFSYQQFGDIAGES